MIIVSLGFIINEVGWAGLIGYLILVKIFFRCCFSVFRSFYKFLDFKINAIVEKKNLTVLG